MPQLGRNLPPEVLERIAALYKVDAAIRGGLADERRAALIEQSRSFIEKMEPWLEREPDRIPGRGKLAEATSYALSRREC